MSMMGYKPPLTKASPSPYANQGPSNPFMTEAAPIEPLINRPAGNYDNEHMRFNPDMSGSLMKAPEIKPRFFESGGVGSRILSALSEATLSYNAQQGDPMSLSILRQRETSANRTADEAQWQSRWKTQQEAEQADREAQRNAPQYFSGNEDRVRFDPMTNTAATVYDAPTDAETYARSQGFAVGTPDYNTALQDFTLRGNGPTAYDFRTGLEGTRADNRTQLQDRRAKDRVALRKVPTFRDLNPPAPRLGGLGRGPARGGAAGGPVEGQSATGPGGHKIVVRGGRWVDAQSGRPVG